MLLYNNRFLSRLVLQLGGSCFFRADCIILGALVAGLSSLILYLKEQNSPLIPAITDPYASHAFGAVVAFALVFRTDAGWKRYWEGADNLAKMYSKWTDSFVQVCAFGDASVNQLAQQGDVTLCTVIHDHMETLLANFTVLSALAVHRLMEGYVARVESRSETWSDMRANWRDTLVTREMVHKDVTSPLPDVVAFSEMPTLSLQAAEQTKARSSFADVRYVASRLPGKDAARLLEPATDRVFIMAYHIEKILAELSPLLLVESPIQSRIYQQLSEGMLGYNQCRKLADIPFPFPYAQLLTLVLVSFVGFIPFYVALFTENVVLSPLIAFFLTIGYWGLNETAKELENPFGQDINDIELVDFHSTFVNICMELFANHEEVLASNDLVEAIGAWSAEVEGENFNEEPDSSEAGSASAPGSPKSLKRQRTAVTQGASYRERIARISSREGGKDPPSPTERRSGWDSGDEERSLSPPSTDPPSLPGIDPTVVPIGP
jgi:predicted membrane chloride channel (bestrophin family)